MKTFLDEEAEALDASAAADGFGALADSFLGSYRILKFNKTHYTAIEELTLPLGFAASLAPNYSVKAASTAFLTSSGLAQRSSGEVFRPPITAPRFAQPVTAAVVM